MASLVLYWRAWRSTCMSEPALAMWPFWGPENSAVENTSFATVCSRGAGGISKICGHNSFLPVVANLLGTVRSGCSGCPIYTALIDLLCCQAVMLGRINFYHLFLVIVPWDHCAECLLKALFWVYSSKAVLLKLFRLEALIIWLERSP